uniref:Uncharacterized protein n=1 Tax=Corethron hystrix TaxID=216773 RepID=A0A6U5LK81_9STRA|mmetsp:Transcript_59/g.134  ORF Transcript_59/g.134 Transcript_59/m.134 type:complete len:1409 (+) Transcript_59:379-4605(+)
MALFRHAVDPSDVDANPTTTVTTSHGAAVTTAKMSTMMPTNETTTAMTDSVIVSPSSPLMPTMSIVPGATDGFLRIEHCRPSETADSGSPTVADEDNENGDLPPHSHGFRTSHSGVRPIHPSVPPPSAGCSHPSTVLLPVLPPPSVLADPLLTPKFGTANRKKMTKQQDYVCHDNVNTFHPSESRRSSFCSTRKTLHVEDRREEEIPALSSTSTGSSSESNEVYSKLKPVVAVTFGHDETVAKEETATTSPFVDDSPSYPNHIRNDRSVVHTDDERSANNKYHTARSQQRNPTRSKIGNLAASRLAYLEKRISMAASSSSSFNNIDGDDECKIQLYNEDDESPKKEEIKEDYLCQRDHLGPFQPPYYDTEIKSVHDFRLNSIQEEESKESTIEYYLHQQNSVLTSTSSHIGLSNMPLGSENLPLEPRRHAPPRRHQSVSDVSNIRDDDPLSRLRPIMSDRNGNNTTSVSSTLSHHDFHDTSVRFIPEDSATKIPTSDNDNNGAPVDRELSAATLTRRSSVTDYIATNLSMVSITTASDVDNNGSVGSFQSFLGNSKSDTGNSFEQNDDVGRGFSLKSLSEEHSLEQRWNTRRRKERLRRNANRHSKTLQVLDSGNGRRFRNDMGEGVRKASAWNNWMLPMEGTGVGGGGNRHISEIIPSFTLMHIHLRRHLSRQGVCHFNSKECATPLSRGGQQLFSSRRWSTPSNQSSRAQEQLDQVGGSNGPSRNLTFLEEHSTIPFEISSDHVAADVFKFPHHGMTSTPSPSFNHLMFKDPFPVNNNKGEGNHVDSPPFPVTPTHNLIQNIPPEDIIRAKSTHPSGRPPPHAVAITAAFLNCLVSTSERSHGNGGCKTMLNTHIRMKSKQHEDPSSLPSRNSPPDLPLERKSVSVDEKNVGNKVVVSKSSQRSSLPEDHLLDRCHHGMKDLVLLNTTAKSNTLSVMVEENPLSIEVVLAARTKAGPSERQYEATACACIDREDEVSFLSPDDSTACSDTSIDLNELNISLKAAVSDRNHLMSLMLVGVTDQQDIMSTPMLEDVLRLVHAQNEETSQNIFLKISKEYLVRKWRSVSHKFMDVGTSDTKRHAEMMEGLNHENFDHTPPSTTANDNEDVFFMSNYLYNTFAPPILDDAREQQNQTDNLYNDGVESVISNISNEIQRPSGLCNILETETFDPKSSNFSHSSKAQSHFKIAPKMTCPPAKTSCCTLESIDNTLFELMGNCAKPVPDVDVHHVQINTTSGVSPAKYFGSVLGRLWGYDHTFKDHRGRVFHAPRLHRKRGSINNEENYSGLKSSNCSSNNDPLSTGHESRGLFRKRSSLSKIGADGTYMDPIQHPLPQAPPISPYIMLSYKESMYNEEKSPEDFFKLCGYTPGQFDDLPTWKQEEILLVASEMLKQKMRKEMNMALAVNVDN